MTVTTYITEIYSSFLPASRLFTCSPMGRFSVLGLGSLLNMYTCYCWNRFSTESLIIERCNLKGKTNSIYKNSWISYRVLKNIFIFKLINTGKVRETCGLSMTMHLFISDTNIANIFAFNREGPQTWPSRSLDWNLLD